ncbi:GNAT family N-acetyltransferase [Bacillus sp. FSL W7-1360]
MMTRLIPIQQPVHMETLKNLVSLYLHDLSAYTSELQPNEQGVFEYEGLHLYEQDERLHAFLISHDSHIAGFVMVNEPPYTADEVDYCVNELFVLNAFRKKGVAQAAIELVFEKFPGKYLNLQMVENARAIAFWRKVYERIGIPYSEAETLYDGELCNVQHFATSKS